MQTTMRGIVVTGIGNVTMVSDIPMPVLQDYQSLVRVHTCGFCNGTDMQIINGTITEAEGLMPFPTILGHEGACEVIETGRKVKHIHIGDRFIYPDTPKWCGSYSCTFGTMAEYSVVYDRQAMREDGIAPDLIPTDNRCCPFPKDISFEDGAVLLSLLECISAVHNFGLGAGMKVLIYGAGPMGMGVANYLHLLGADVVLVDGIQERLDYAQKNFDITKIVNFHTTPLEALYSKQSFDAVIDLVGSSKVLLEGTSYLCQGGKLCSMGVLKKTDSTMNVSLLQNNTCLHMLNFPYRRMSYMPELIGMIRSGQLNPKLFYSHVLPPEHIDDCVNMIRSKQALKVIISFDL